MQFFLHFKIQKVDEFLDRLSCLNELYKNKTFQFDKEFYSFIDSFIQYLKQIGDSGNQSEAEQIRNIYQTANEGFDPIKLELVKTNRRAMKRTMAFHCLSRITDILQTELQKDQNAISKEELEEDLDQEKLKIIWQRVSQNENVKLHERNLKLTIAVEDIFLLFTAIILKIKD